MKSILKKSTKNYWIDILEYDSDQQHTSRFRIYFYNRPQIEFGVGDKQYVLALTKKSA